MSINIHDADSGKLILRLCVGGLMLFHGVAKIIYPGSLEFIAGMLAGFSLPAVLAYGVYIGEVVAPLMLIAGYKVRTGAILIVINMLFAIILAHSGDLFSLSEHGGWMVELQMFFLFSALAVMFLGAGKYAIKPD